MWCCILQCGAVVNSFFGTTMQNNYKLLPMTLGIWCNLRSSDCEMDTYATTIETETKTESDIESQISGDKKRHKCKPKTIMNVLYVVFIIGIILWRPIYVIVHFHRHTHYMANFFVFVIPVQYVLFFRYVTTLHLYKTIEDSMGVMPSGLVFYRKYQKMTIAISLLFSIISLVVFIMGGDVHVYSSLRNYGIGGVFDVILGTVCLIEHFFICCICMSVFSVFFVVFTIHKHHVKKLIDSINEVNSDGQFSPLFSEYKNIKCKFEESVSLMNILFSTTTLLGLAASYGTMIHIKIVGFNILNTMLSVVYFVLEILYFYTIYEIRKYIDYIKTAVVSGSLPQKCMDRKIFSVYNSEENKANRMYADDIAKMQSQIVVSMDWFTIRESFTQSWASFSILGFSIENTLIDKFVALIWIYIATLATNDYFDLHLQK